MKTIEQIIKEKEDYIAKYNSYIDRAIDNYVDEMKRTNINAEIRIAKLESLKAELEYNYRKIEEEQKIIKIIKWEA